MPATKNPTLSDVAARAGVSPTTASYILNGRSVEMRISPDTQQRVRDAVAELGYRPNRSARSLRTARTSTIGLISDFVASGEFASQMLTGASAASRACDHLLVIGETGGDPELEDQLIEEMLDRQVDGLVYATLTASRVTVPRKLLGRRVVLLNCFDPETDLPSVLPDERQGGRLAAEIVLGAGRAQRVQVIGQDPNPVAIAGPRRLEGIVDRLGAAGHTLAGVLECDWTVHDAFAAVDGWLNAGGDPTALICLNDRIAMGAYEALAEHGIAVGRHVSVVSFDGSSLATWLRPALTSVALPFNELGSRAVQMLMDPQTPHEVVELPLSVLEGSSI